MSHTLKFDGAVKGGRFIPEDSQRFKKALMSREGKASQLTLGPIPRGRSDPQLRFYWGVLIDACRLATGAEPDDFHEEFKEKVLRPFLERRTWKALPNGKHLLGRPSTGALSLDEMTTYIGLCRDYAYGEWDVEVEDIDHVSMR